MSPSRRFLYLVLDEHPYGREMLRAMLEADLRPDRILVEASDLAEVERRKFLSRIEGHPVAPEIADQARRAGIPVQRVPAHTDRHCLEAIREEAPDLVVLGGTRIIRGRMLALPADGVLNAHPGLLPDCRGSASPAWSVLHDIPIGASCHFCTERIDEGDLVGRREIPVRRGSTYEDLCHLTLVEAGRLMREALEAWRDGRLEALRRPQGESPHPTFRNMPEELLAVVRRKLRDQTYACYAD
jgi:methionyl-tRNA formyltransferase